MAQSRALKGTSRSLAWLSRKRSIPSRYLRASPTNLAPSGAKESNTITHFSLIDRVDYVAFSSPGPSVNEDKVLLWPWARFPLATFLVKKCRLVNYLLCDLENLTLLSVESIAGDLATRRRRSLRLGRSRSRNRGWREERDLYGERQHFRFQGSGLRVHFACLNVDHSSTRSYFSGSFAARY